jgi:hypothetical protein
MDETKLPKWAQQELDTLRMRLRESEERAERFRVAREGGGADTNTRLADYITHKDFQLGNGASVEFELDKRQVITVRVGTDNKGGPKTLFINGYRAIRIMPRASNAIQITGEE